MSKRMRPIVFLTICFLLMMTVGPFTPTTEAWFRKFKGGPIFDILKIWEVIEQLERAKAIVKRVEDDLKHLEKMDLTTAELTREYIRQQYERLIMVRNTVRGLTFTYTQLQKEWDKTFKDFAEFNDGIKAVDYAKYLEDLDQKTSNALYDAMRAQGLIVYQDKDRIRIEGLMDASRAGNGDLAAIQVANYIAGLQSVQLARMEVVMTTSFRAQTLYYKWMLEQRKSQRDYAKKNEIGLDDPVKSAGSAEEFPKF